MTNAIKRVLPADVYDALAASAERFGGVGAGRYYEAGGVPFCIVGHACTVMATDAYTALAVAFEGQPVQANDRAVSAVIQRRADLGTRRIPFPDWCAELGVERGA